MPVLDQQVDGGDDLARRTGDDRGIVTRPDLDLRSLGETSGDRLDEGELAQVTRRTSLTLSHLLPHR